MSRFSLFFSILMSLNCIAQEHPRFVIAKKIQAASDFANELKNQREKIPATAKDQQEKILIKEIAAWRSYDLLLIERDKLRGSAPTISYSIFNRTQSIKTFLADSKSFKNWDLELEKIGKEWLQFPTAHSLDQVLILGNFLIDKREEYKLGLNLILTVLELNKDKCAVKNLPVFEIALRAMLKANDQPLFSKYWQIVKNCPPAIDGDYITKLVFNEKNREIYLITAKKTNTNEIEQIKKPHTKFKSFPDLVNKIEEDKTLSFEKIQKFLLEQESKQQVDPKVKTANLNFKNNLLLQREQKWKLQPSWEKRGLDNLRNLKPKMTAREVAKLFGATIEVEGQPMTLAFRVNKPFQLMGAVDIYSPLFELEFRFSEKNEIAAVIYDTAGVNSSGNLYVFYFP